MSAVNYNKVCPECGKEAAAGEAACSNCGYLFRTVPAFRAVVGVAAPRPIARCAHCGAVPPETAQFCPACGWPQAGRAPSMAPLPIVVIPYTPPVEPRVVPTFTLRPSPAASPITPDTRLWLIFTMWGAFVLTALCVLAAFYATGHGAEPLSLMATLSAAVACVAAVGCAINLSRGESLSERINGGIVVTATVVAGLAAVIGMSATGRLPKTIAKLANEWGYDDTDSSVATAKDTSATPQNAPVTIDKAPDMKPPILVTEIHRDWYNPPPQRPVATRPIGDVGGDPFARAYRVTEAPEDSTGWSSQPAPNPAIRYGIDRSNLYPPIDEVDGYGVTPRAPSPIPSTRRVSITIDSHTGENRTVISDSDSLRALQNSATSEEAQTGSALRGKADAERRLGQTDAARADYARAITAYQSESADGSDTDRNVDACQSALDAMGTPQSHSKPGVSVR